MHGQQNIKVLIHLAAEVGHLQILVSQEQFLVMDVAK
jgi:hypothetical protein